MTSEDFLCEDCGFRALKGGSCPRCDSEMTSLKDNDNDPYALDDEEDEEGEVSYSDDFDFSDEVAMI